ncbi:MAG TPA: molecular chaperone HtpG, partial [Rectinemataceae bacterium]
MSKHAFKTEVSKLLELITHSLYSHKEIFLRELISNASDAIDKLRYLTISDDAYKSISLDPRIVVYLDEKAKTITVTDNGVGMDEKELGENLGTIARSGTRNFLEKLSEGDRKDSNLIGQFGVGFYSVFMVADKVEVISKKAGTDAAFRWESSGKGEYSVEPASREGFGTDVVVHVNAQGEEYLYRWNLDSLLKKYSNHIAYPIHLISMEPKYDDKGKEKGKELKDEQTNAASALWRRPKSELSDKDYIDFYKSFTGEEEEPLFWIHTKAEGTIEYNSLLYVPSKVPGDLYYPVSQQGIKLYIKRVFITDKETSFLPQYFRFVRGVVDSDDLPLNVSREILQQNRVMTTIQQGTLKKLFSELESMSKNNPEKYAKFIELFGVQIKEGIVSDWQNQKTLLGLVRYKSTAVEGWTSLSDCKARAGDRKTIYYITGNSEERLRSSPLLEAFAAKGIEVLLGSDELDELAFSSIGQYEECTFKSVNHADSDEALGSAASEDGGKEAVEAAKRILGSKVKDVRLSKRLAKSPSCVVMDSDDPTFQYRELMKRISNADLPESAPILELNPAHPLVKRLGELKEGQDAEDLAHI